MKHAFLICAHTNWWQLKQLILLLDDPEHDIYIHIDKKSNFSDQDMFMHLAKFSKVSLYQEYEVYWGGFSIIRSELLLMKEAVKEDYDYFHLMSGMDLPLKTNRQLHDFFDTHAGQEFIDYNEDKLMHDPEIARRAKLYHFLQNYRRRYEEKWKNDMFTFMERVSLVLQILLRVNRNKKNLYDIKYGSNWMSITGDLVKTVLENEDYIYHSFKWVNCADELYIQTIAYNCGFRDRIHRAGSANANLREIDWDRGKNGNPYIYTMDDYEMLVKSENLFARKFSETVDKEIIRKIRDHIEQEKDREKNRNVKEVRS